MSLWRRSYPEVVERGHRFWIQAQYLDAAQEYWLAAFVTPTLDDETAMLQAAWIASERAQDRRSEMEAWT